MTEQKKKVHLYGALREMACAETIEFAVKTPQQLINALNSQVKGFEAFTRENEIAIVMGNGGTEEADFAALNPMDLKKPFNDMEHVHVLPKVQGSGFEIAGFVLGVAAGSTAAAIALGVVINLAISFVVSAVMKALAPSPDSSEGAAEAAKRPSFLFNGAKLVSEQGYAIPVVYGLHNQGGILISTDLDVEDVPMEPVTFLTPPNSPMDFGRGATVPVVTEQWGMDLP